MVELFPNYIFGHNSPIPWDSRLTKVSKASEWLLEYFKEQTKQLPAVFLLRIPKRDLELNLRNPNVFTPYFHP